MVAASAVLGGRPCGKTRSRITSIYAAVGRANTRRRGRDAPARACYLLCQHSRLNPGCQANSLFRHQVHATEKIVILATPSHRVPLCPPRLTLPNHFTPNQSLTVCSDSRSWSQSTRRETTSLFSCTGATRLHRTPNRRPTLALMVVWCRHGCRRLCASWVGGFSQLEHGLRSGSQLQLGTVGRGSDSSV